MECNYSSYERRYKSMGVFWYVEYAPNYRILKNFEFCNIRLMGIVKDDISVVK